MEFLTVKEASDISEKCSATIYKWIKDGRLPRQFTLDDLQATMKEFHKEIVLDVCENDLRYFAGIFDGEGCITISKETCKRRNGMISHTLTLALNNTNRQAIEWIHAKFKGSARYNIVKKERNRSIIHRWVASSRQAMNILRLVSPFLIIKKAEADFVLENELVLTQGKQNGRKKVDNELFEKREACHSALQELKHPGKRFYHGRNLIMS